MAVNLKIASRISALALALASLTLPAIAEAQDNGNRGGWRTARENGGGSRGDGGSRSESGSRGEDGWRGGGRDGGGGGWQQRSQAPAPQSAPQHGWSQRSAGHAPPPQAATPPAPSRATWGRDGGNTRNWEGRGNGEGHGDERRGWEGRRGRDGHGGGDGRGWEGRSGRDGHGWQGGHTATTTHTPATVPATTGSSRWGHGGSHDGDGRHRDWRRDGDVRSSGSWSSRSHDGDRHRDGNHWRDNDRHRDGNHWRHNNRHGWNDRDRNHHRWDRRWRDNHRYNWHSYRTHYPNYYNLGSYYSPYRHHRYRRLNVGFFLDSLFYGQRYWIGNPGYYRLPDAYGPYRWVRYYDDALLVDIYSGEVVDVIHNFFW